MSLPLIFRSSISDGYLDVSDDGEGVRVESIDFSFLTLPERIRVMKCVECVVEWGKLSKLRKLEVVRGNVPSFSLLPESLRVLVCYECKMSPKRRLRKLCSFSNLEILDCSGNRLEKISELPPRLKILTCSKCELESLPFLPGTLVELTCSMNSLRELPLVPPGLKRLNCNYNRLRWLPSMPGVEVLSVLANKVKVLPLLPSLVCLFCDGNELEYLCPLPGSLKELHCSLNRLKVLPVLPEKLERLDCRRNRLKRLPLLPGRLLFLDCSNNKLRFLPPVSGKLKELTCQGNGLVMIPPVPISAFVRGVPVPARYAKRKRFVFPSLVDLAALVLPSLPLPRHLVGVRKRWMFCTSCRRFGPVVKTKKYQLYYGDRITCERLCLGCSFS